MSEVKERPILFSAPMVKALLAGKKTQTRRIVKPDPDSEINPVIVDGTWQWATMASRRRCPYGVPGDRLWVRETWATRPSWDHVKPSEVPKGYAIYTRADEPDVAVEKWRPSLFMPRWASRITLDVCLVRVERLNEIIGADARAEGISDLHCYGPGCLDGPNGCNARGCIGAREAYEKLWETIHGPGSWALNPWVWIIEFRKIDQL